MHIEYGKNTQMNLWPQCNGMDEWLECGKIVNAVWQQVNGGITHLSFIGQQKQFILGTSEARYSALSLNEQWAMAIYDEINLQ